MNENQNMIEGQPQQKYRDRLFIAIFGKDTERSKRWRLDLYNALNGTSYTDPNALKLNTIENVIFVTMYNDVSFLVDSQMTLYEQQSRPNANMPRPRLATPVYRENSKSSFYRFLQRTARTSGTLQAAFVRRI